MYTTGPINGLLHPVPPDATFPTTEAVDYSSEDSIPVPPTLTSFTGGLNASWCPSDQHPTLLYNKQYKGAIGHLEMVATERSNGSNIHFKKWMFGFEAKPVAHFKTIRGNIVVVDTRFGLTTLFKRAGDVNYQIVEQDIDVKRVSPFMCPYTGVLGAMGADGRVFLWQQK
ncbi:hypothetical protein FRB99_004619 [Tulasnella sp. 403]|nr:hypothetical protein FRB99_004619 [Tulasnella sp. 403]